MQVVRSTAFDKKVPRFRLIELMELVTVSGVLFALSTATGVAASIFLLLMTIAVMMRAGLTAVFMLAAAMVTADWAVAEASEPEWTSAIAVVTVSASLCAWFRLRRFSPAVFEFLRNRRVLPR